MCIIRVYCNAAEKVKLERDGVYILFVQNHKLDNNVNLFNKGSHMIYIAYHEGDCKVKHTIAL